MKQPKCRRNHVISEVGRDSCGRCKACRKLGKNWEHNKTYNKIYNKRYNKKYYKSVFKEKHWAQYGITKTDGLRFTQECYRNLYKKQNGRCAICSRHSSLFVKDLAVDHDHKTGFVRGLLCIRCNRSLGNVNDDKGLLLSMVSYLSKT